MMAMTAAVLTLLATALPAFAQEMTSKQGLQTILLRCHPEAAACSAATNSKDKMSANCKAWAERVKANAASLKEACSKEIDASCNSEKGDPLGMLNCLQGNYINLSPECVAALNQFKWRYPQPVR
jgi:hypothetical protein